LELVDRFIFGSPRHLRSYELIRIYFNPGKKLYWFRDYELDISYNIEYIQSDQLSGALLYQIIRYNLRWVTTGILKKDPNGYTNPYESLGHLYELQFWPGIKIWFRIC